MSAKAGILGAPRSPKAERVDFSTIFPAAELQEGLEAAFLLKATGIPLASWTRDPVPQEVVSVMAATMWGSLDTLVRTLGGEAPRSAFLEVGDRRMLAMEVGANWMLFLVGPRSTGRRQLRREAQRIAERVSRVRVRDMERAPAVDLRE